MTDQERADTPRLRRGTPADMMSNVPLGQFDRFIGFSPPLFL